MRTCGIAQRAFESSLIVENHTQVGDLALGIGNEQLQHGEIALPNLSTLQW